ncbi:DNA-binding response regulator [Halalkalibacter hemicellulosilyticusJCM 9152]|uniref:DNA-binding response regulator n=2 Tax=Halalkalibacter TaxID=2893056 RepID=W4QIA5_9BACI|nr:DNA-binding response regulator [Halalkalibacter hemicellulosilyticusJCM 9152]
MIRAVLIDDEPLAIQLLQSKLEATKEYEIVGTYASESELRAKVDDLDFDVAFIDINLKVTSGMDLAEFLLSKMDNLQVVFVTSYEEYAVRAFELHAVDYLLKPVLDERLIKTTKRLKEAMVLLHSEAREVVHEPVRIYSFLELMVYRHKELVNWKTGKVKELFAYLFTYHEQYVDRDLIIEALWPDEDYKKSKIHLHTCVYHLRKLLQSLGFHQAISFSDKCYSLSLINVQNDVDEWQALMSEFDRDPDRFSIHQFDRVLHLYRGKYLERNDYDWARDRSFTYQYKMDQFLNVMKKKYKEQHERALKCIMLLSEEDPYSEELLKEELDHLRAMGQVAEAKARYHEFSLRLRSDLGLETSDSLMSYYRTYFQ